MHLLDLSFICLTVCIVYQMYIINSAIYVRFNQELFMYFTPFLPFRMSLENVCRAAVQRLFCGD